MIETAWEGATMKEFAIRFAVPVREVERIQAEQKETTFLRCKFDHIVDAILKAQIPKESA